MKKTFFLPLLLSFTLVGCNKDVIDEKIENPIVTGDELRFARAASFQSLNAPNSEGWEVKSIPDWIGIKEKHGIPGEQIEIYIEDNVFDEDRLDTLTIASASGALHKYPIRQLGAFSDPDNGILGNGDVSRTYGVGMGINVLSNNTRFKYDICSAVVNVYKIGNCLEEIGEAEAFWDDEAYSSSTNSYAGSSSLAISNQLSVEAGIGVEVSGFDAKIKGAFSTKESSDTKTSYAMRDIKHIVKSRYLRGGALRYITENNSSNCLATGLNRFIEDLKDPTYADKKSTMRIIVNNYGTHMVTYGAMGGSLQLAISKESTEVLSQQDILASLEVSVKGTVGVTGEVKLSDKEKKFVENTTISVVTYGGKNPGPVAVGTPFDEVLNKYLDADSLNNWISTLRSDVPDSKKELALIDVKVVPIWDLIPDKAVSEMLHEYIVTEYQKELTKHEPLIYVVDGLDAQHPGVDQGFAELPEINVRLEYFDGIVPEIDSQKAVRIVYSGTMDKMNYDRGFCIGGDGITPGKLKRDRYGKYSYEPFTGLDDSRITSVYVDISGDVTIAPKSTINYVNRRFSVGGIKEFTKLDDINFIVGIGKVCAANNPAYGSILDIEEFWDDTTQEGQKTWYNTKWAYEEHVMTRTGRFPKAVKDYADKYGLILSFSGGYHVDMNMTDYTVYYCFYDKDKHLLTSQTEELNKPTNNVHDYRPFTYDFDMPKDAEYLIARFTLSENKYLAPFLMMSQSIWCWQVPLRLTASPAYIPNPLVRK